MDLKWHKAVIIDGRMWTPLPEGTRVLVARSRELFTNPTIGPTWWVMKRVGLWQVAELLCGPNCGRTVRLLGEYEDQSAAIEVFEPLYASHCRRAKNLPKPAQKPQKPFKMRL